jgi:hypothetical protein
MIPCEDDDFWRECVMHVCYNTRNTTYEREKDIIEIAFIVLDAIGYTHRPIAVPVAMPHIKLQ